MKENKDVWNKTIYELQYKIKYRSYPSKLHMYFIKLYHNCQDFDLVFNSLILLNLLCLLIALVLKLYNIIAGSCN